ncbi:hypothetical protein D3C71_1281400 [compost metagenome]
MGIRVQRDTVRPQLRNLGQRAVKRLWRLSRQAVDQIHIDGFKTKRTCGLHQRKHLLGRLYAVNGLLNLGIEILHPKAQSVEPQFRQHCKAVRIDGARVHLNRILPARRQRKAAFEHAHQLPQALVR